MDKVKGGRPVCLLNLKNEAVLQFTKKSYTDSLAENAIIY